ncbi:MAG TPA: hypothetical protein VNJ54_03970 [Plantibacter sp.]|uniref:hypothetical protein n=1 Tax=unclassified Plantibacter TaxID=2624265 RepID=UPI002B845FEC|nr:hypothetical protein [Plantibacter sp.]
MSDSHDDSQRDDQDGPDDQSGPDEQHRVPEGVDEATVDAVGRLTEALEIVEQARGLLYTFHRLTGKADFVLSDASAKLRDAGHEAIADRIDADLVGRNVLDGRWTFQIVEDYDDGYWEPFRTLERETRDELVAGRRHLAEAAMKEDRRTHGAAHHEAVPPTTGP